MKLSLYEQETIILYNQAEATAEVYSHDPRLLEKLRRLAEKYPDQIVKRGLHPRPAPAGKAAAAGGEVPGPDREKGPPDLHGAQTLCVGAGAVQRRAPQGRQRTGQSRRV